MRLFLLALSFLLSTSLVFAQAGDKKSGGFDKDKLRFGGSFGLGFSNGFFQMEASPTLGYAITERLTSGLGFVFRYTQYPQQFNPRKFREIGGLAYSRYQVIPSQLFLQSNFELVNADRWVRTTDQFGNPTDQILRKNFASWLIGAGYGSDFGLTIMAFYDILFHQNNYSPGSGASPWVFRMGFGF